MYTAFASVYDRLMTGVDYQGWANFYHALMERYGIPRGKVCECACGTGSLTIPLAAMGYQMTGVDLSPDMLFEASQKARKAGAMIPFVKQDMRQLFEGQRTTLEKFQSVNEINDRVKDIQGATDVLKVLTVKKV